MALNPPFTEEHEELRASVRGFIERELAPHAQTWEDERWFPDEVFGKLAAQGLLGLKYPEQYGGQGGDYLHEAVLIEELARIGSGGTAAGIGAHINIATPPIWKFGTEEQKQRYLAPAIRGEKIGALGITEPGAGSDVAALRTRAEPVDGGWVRQRREDLHHQWRARALHRHGRQDQAGGRPPRHLVPDRRSRRGRRLLEAREARLARLGHRHDQLRGRVRPAGEPARRPARGLRADHGQLPVGAPGDGAGRGRRDARSPGSAPPRSRASARRSAARSRGHQAIRHKLADLATSAYTCRCVTYDALRRFVAGEEPLREVTMAKLLTQRACFELMDECLQIHGGAGYMREYWVERAARDARLGPIGGGSDEIMREILGRVLAL